MLGIIGMRNIITIPSEGDVFVTDLLSKLHACRDTNMIIYGMPKLSNFNHVLATNIRISHIRILPCKIMIFIGLSIPFIHIL